MILEEILYRPCPQRSRQFFHVLCPASAEALDQIRRPAVFPEHSLVFGEGQAPRGVYILCQGQAKISIMSRDGRAFALRIAKPGDVLGLQAVVTGTPYRGSVETTHPSRLSFVAREDFLRFLNEHSDACLQVAQRISRDCHDAYDVVRAIRMSRSISGRVARFMLARAAGARPSRGVVRARLELTHEDIAQLMGTSRESITRTLSEWRKKDIAELKHSTLTIHDKPALMRLMAS